MSIRAYSLLFYFYLFIFRGRGRKGERRGKKHPCAREIVIGCLSHAHNQGPGPQPRPVAQPGIKPAAFQFETMRNPLSPTGQGRVYSLNLQLL